jgi:hypothetical protein
MQKILKNNYNLKENDIMVKREEIKRIGILSMQKVINYGSFLQAFSLMNIIKRLRPEYELLFIDIKPGVSLYQKNDSGKILLKQFLFTKSIL